MKNDDERIALVIDYDEGHKELPQSPTPLSE
jgi:hypothetical protein